MNAMRLLFMSFLLSFMSICAAQSETGWINENAVSTGAGDKYLASLSQQLKGNAILALGEASHGTREFSKEKKRIIDYLIANSGYKAIGFEFGYSTIDAIDANLKTGKNDLKKLMAPLRLFNTEEIYAIFESIRAYNATQPDKNKVTVFGFDTDYFKADIDATAHFCMQYLTQNPKVYKNGNAAIAVLKKVVQPEFEYLATLPDEDLATISKLNDEVKFVKSSAAASQKFRKAVSLLYQGTLVSNPLARDEFMAQNIADFRNASGKKTIVWAHNIHVAKDTTMAQCKGMGFHLRQKYGTKLYAVSFDTFKGSVTTYGNDGFEKHDFEAAPETLSAMFAKANSKAFFLPLKDQLGPMFGKDFKVLNIYANWGKNRPLVMRPGIDFDAVVFIRETTASEGIRN